MDHRRRWSDALPRFGPASSVDEVVQGVRTPLLVHLPSGAAPYDGADKADTDTVVLIAELAADAPVEWDALWQTILALHHVGEDEVRLEPGVRLTIRAVMVNGLEVADCPLIGTNVIA